MAALAVLWTGPAGAVVPEAEEVLSRAAEAWPAAEPLTANLVEAPAEGPPRRAIRVASDGRANVRLEVQDLTTGRTTVTRFSTRADPTRREAVLPLDAAPGWLQWLVGRPVSQVAGALGVDLERTSLAHVGPTILLVVGAGPREADRPQIHVEREAGRLRRIVERREVPEGPPRVLDVIASGRLEDEPPEDAEAAGVLDAMEDADGTGEGPEGDGEPADEEGPEGGADTEGVEEPLGPRARWPDTLTFRRGDQETVWRVDWLRFGPPADERDDDPEADREPAPAPVDAGPGPQERDATP